MDIAVFETIAVHYGKPVFLHTHLDRMEHSLRCLAPDEIFERDDLCREIIERAKNKNDIALKAVWSKEGPIFYQRGNPYRDIDYHRGIDICLGETILDETDPLRFHKTTNREIFDTERKKAAKQGYKEVIFTNRKGHITEGSVSNLFCVKSGKILTPPISDGLLNGIMRRFLLALYPKEIEETVITEKDLFEAEEIFLTNSLMGVLPVCSLEGKRYLTGGKGTAISHRYKALIETLATEK